MFHLQRDFIMTQVENMCNLDALYWKVAKIDIIIYRYSETCLLSESVPSSQVSLHHRFLYMGNIGNHSEKMSHDHNVSFHQSDPWRQVLLCNETCKNRTHDYRAVGISDDYRADGISHDYRADGISHYYRADGISHYYRADGISHDYRADGISEHMITELMGYQNTWLPSWWDIRTHDYRADGISEHMITELMGYQNTWLLSWWDIRTHDYRADGISEHMITELMGYQNHMITELMGYQNTWLLSCWNIRITWLLSCWDIRITWLPSWWDIRWLPSWWDIRITWLTPSHSVVVFQITISLEGYHDMGLWFTLKCLVIQSPMML